MGFFSTLTVSIPVVVQNEVASLKIIGLLDFFGNGIFDVIKGI